MTSNGPGAGSSGVGGGGGFNVGGSGGISGNPGGVRDSCGRRITFDNVGGLDEHVKVLKEILLLPLMYKDVYTRFSIKPPRGVLFYGPPGTGKTLVAGALANECSRPDRKVAFFSRKGADCYSKYVGESEQKLRSIFQEARQQQPAIIFFDEIDGLAPTRSSHHDIVHASVVSTLLALMDGLDTSSDVVVIGATNRIDAIDPALRRSGRFDRELYFPLPSEQARQQILQVHLRHWRRPPSDAFIQKLAANTSGYCGSDLQALCSEAVLCALSRVYPDIYDCSVKQRINFTALRIEERDFNAARTKILAASRRVFGCPVRKLSSTIRPLLQEPLTRAIHQLQQLCPFINMPSNRVNPNQCEDASSLPCPSLLLIGQCGQGQSTHLGPALLHHLEQFPTTVLDIAALFEHSGSGTEKACINRIQHASQHMPAVLYLPEVTSWWYLVDDATRAVFLALAGRLDSTMPILLLATTHGQYEHLPASLRNLWRKSEGQVFVLSNPSNLDREAFFKKIFLEQTTKPSPSRSPFTESYCNDQNNIAEERMMRLPGEDTEDGQSEREIDFLQCTYDNTDSEDSESIGKHENTLNPNGSVKHTRGIKNRGRLLRRKNTQRNTSGRRSPIQTRSRSRARAMSATGTENLRRQRLDSESSRSRSRSRSPSRCKTRRHSTNSEDRHDLEEMFTSRLVEILASDAMSNASKNASSVPEMRAEDDGEVSVNDAMSARSPPNVLIDTAALFSLLQRAVKITENESVRTLEGLHAALSTAILPFECRVDRQSLPRVLSAVLDKFEEKKTANGGKHPDENCSSDNLISVNHVLSKSESMLPVLDDRGCPSGETNNEE